MRFLQGHDLDTEIQKILAEPSPRCAVAFLGRGAPGLFDDSRPAKIICNLTSGGTNPFAIEELQSAHEIRHNSKLHAKVYLGSASAIVTSANLSANGLGLEADALSFWIEAGILTDQADEIARWFEELWSDPASQTITTADIETAKQAWKNRQTMRPTAASFAEFDIDAEELPFIVWWHEVKDKFNNEALFGNEVPDDVVRDLTDGSYPIEDDEERNILLPGRWLLWWYRKQNGLPGRNGYSWTRLGRIIHKAHRYSHQRRWNDLVLNEPGTAPEPFDCREAKFRAAFEATISRPEFSELRVGDYEGSYLLPRQELMRSLWRATKETYLQL
jgi:hypothetical protein